MAFEEEKTIALRKPIVLGELSYDHLDLREPLAFEIAKAQTAVTSADAAITLISLVAKVPRKVVEQLCQRDFNEANLFLAQAADSGEPVTGTD